MTTPDPFAPGYRLTDGNQLNYEIANPSWSISNPVSATVGGTLATSTPITFAITNITTAAAPGAGVTLPQALPGKLFLLVNNSANDVRVFAEGDSTVSGVDGQIGILLPKNLSALVVATAVRQWQLLDVMVGEYLADYLIPFGDGSNTYTSSPNFMYKNNSLSVGSDNPASYTGYSSVVIGGTGSATDGGIDINYINGTYGIELYVATGTTPADDYQTLYGADSDGTSLWTLEYSSSVLELYTYQAAPILFSTNSAERMRITDLGDVGIGTSNPSHYNNFTTLTLGGSAKNSEIDFLYTNDEIGIQMYISPGATSADAAQTIYMADRAGDGCLYVGYDGDNTGYGGYLYVIKNQPLSLWTNSLERMRISALGDVGIGTTSPINSSGYTTLTLGGDSSKGGQFVFNYDDGSVCSEIYAANGSPGNDYIEWDASNSSGDGLGGLYFYEPYNSFFSTDRPNYFEASGTNLGVGSAADTQIYLEPSTTGLISFYTNSSERMRLTAAGSLLIGTTTSGASKLVVADDSIQINTAKTPASASATGTTGQIAWDSTHIYVCVATNTWKRVSILSW